MSRIFLDTNFFIHLIEGASPSAARVKYLLRAFSARRDEILTSVMTLGEVLVMPIRNRDIALAQQYRRIFKGPGISVLPFQEDAAERFAQIRADTKIKPPDAIQLAVAGSAGCDLFLTNDRRLHSLNIPGIGFITPLDKSPL